MAKIIKAFVDSISGRGNEGTAGLRVKDIEYVYIFSPRENGTGFYAVCAGK